MITEQSFDSKILNPNILEEGTIYAQYCLISKIMTKFDSAGKCFLHLNMRGKDGTPIVGRIFGDSVSEYLNNIEKYVNSVVFAEFYVDVVYGQKCLNVSWMKLPEGNDFKGIKIDLFESIVPNIGSYVQGIKELFEKYKCVFSLIGNNIMKQSAFSSLYYTSNEDICSGQCGYAYVLLYNCWSRLEDYYKLGYITEDDVAIMFISQLISECVLLNTDSMAPDYHYIVYTKISQLIGSTSKIGTQDEHKKLRTVLTGYTDLRLNNPSSKSESKLASIMYREFSAIWDNLEYLTSLNLYKGTMLFNGKVIR